MAVLALAGCGGGDGGSSSETTTTTTVFNGPLAAPDGQAILNVPISTTEFAISPEYTRLSIPGIYTIDVTNEGRIPHAIVVERKRDGVKVTSPPIPPGKTVDFKPTCPTQGHTTCTARSTATARRASTP